MSAIRMSRGSEAKLDWTRATSRAMLRELGGGGGGVSVGGFLEGNGVGLCVKTCKEFIETKALHRHGSYVDHLKP